MFPSLRSRSGHLRSLFRGFIGRGVPSILRSYSPLPAAYLGKSGDGDSHLAATMKCPSASGSGDQNKRAPWVMQWKNNTQNIRNVWIADNDSGSVRLGEGLDFYTSGRDLAAPYIIEYPGPTGGLFPLDFEALGVVPDDPSDDPLGFALRSKANTICWGSYMINAIKNPSDVDPSVGVASALRVVDSAILAVCGVEGVRSQSITVDRQMGRYEVPRLVFIDNLDRPTADPWKVISQARCKLQLHSAAVQVPIRGDKFEGMFDLIDMAPYDFDNANGNLVHRTYQIPSDLVDFAFKKRHELIQVVSEVDDELAKSFLNGEEISGKDLKGAIRRATIAHKFVPVFMGSTCEMQETKAISMVLDGIALYLPSPTEVQNYALLEANSLYGVALSRTPNGPLFAVAFSMLKGCFSGDSEDHVALFRIYDGVIEKGGYITNMNTKKWFKVRGLMLVHPDGMESVEEAHAGQMVAVLSVDCAPGDTFVEDPHCVR